MEISKVTQDIYQLSTTVRDLLFEGIWTIPHGVTLNSYIVKGEKTALIDGVCGWDGVPENFFGLMNQLNIQIRDIDYLVINHMEPDHSGWIEQLKEIRPDFKIVCTKASEQLLDIFYDYDMNIHVVKDGDILDLGNGKVLTFATAPNVHWPDTMVTYEQSSGTLFSCDIFGSYGAIDGKRYDDQLSLEELTFFESEAIRYYANIISAFNKFAIKGLEKIRQLDLQIIAPGHGIVWRENPNRILNDYIRYSGYQLEPNKDEVTVLYGSMYGMTTKAVDYVESLLEKEGKVIHRHQVPETSWSEVLGSIWSSAYVVLAMPTYEYKMFPPMASILDEIGKKKVLNRQVLRLGSYGWSGGAQKDLEHWHDEAKLNWSFVEPVEFKGAPTQADFNRIEEQVSILLKSKVYI